MRIKSFKEWWSDYKGSGFMQADLFFLGVSVGCLMSGDVGMFAIMAAATALSLLVMISFKKKTEE